MVPGHFQRRGVATDRRRARPGGGRVDTAPVVLVFGQAYCLSHQPHPGSGTFPTDPSVSYAKQQLKTLKALASVSATPVTTGKK